MFRKKTLALTLAALPLVAGLGVLALAPGALAQAECRDHRLDASLDVYAQYCLGEPSVWISACSAFPQDNAVTNTVNHVVGCRVIALP